MSWLQVIIGSLTVLVPLLLFMLKNKREAKADVDNRHKETQEKLDKLMTEGRYFPPHVHGERSGNLTVDGITYPPKW